MARPNTASRQQSYLFGLKAEQIAKWILRLKGYNVIAERYRNAFGEIDIVATKDDLLVCVEVKARQRFKDCLEAVTPMQQQRIGKASASLLAYPAKLGQYINPQTMSVRYDLIMVVPKRLPRHIKDAWRP